MCRRTESGRCRDTTGIDSGGCYAEVEGARVRLSDGGLIREGGVTHTACPKIVARGRDSTCAALVARPRSQVGVTVRFATGWRRLRDGATVVVVERV
ncbi:glycylpeptide N-tetradecanoyltransferase 1 [Iris pallida]|uniref:Glycylpeptide N-tetradecanoyltransferase 1 n=1 Tax=Iris pallida TaxID=29817 RepID=A0AAX6F2D9_IRIPA|nr:glycylpeptide N-tetradecanoyltransferase 1 [Iris pallida]